MKKIQYIMVIMLSILVALSIPIVTLANPDGSGTDAVKQPQNLATNKDVIQKQGEIDRYVFETHAEEILKQGFQVTHTSPYDETIVEIGITPFNEENANYLYQIFGKDSIKVIEGDMATVLMSTTGIGKEDVISTTQEQLLSTNSTLKPFIWYLLAGGMVVGASILIFKKRPINK